MGKVLLARRPGPRFSVSTGSSTEHVASRMKCGLAPLLTYQCSAKGHPAALAAGRVQLDVRQRPVQSFTPHFHAPFCFLTTGEP